MKNNKDQKYGNWITIGMLIGAVIGAITDNIGFWVGMGFLLGAVVGRIISKELTPSK
jgi:uncharacterized membrane protein